MSLAIVTDKVEGVLLADKWHDVKPGSFTVDAYEFIEGGKTVLAGGQVQGITSTGAKWTEPTGTVVACPLTAVLAVKWSEPTTEARVPISIL